MVSVRQVVFVTLLGIGLFVMGGPNAVNVLPLFSDHTGPTELTVTDFERLDAGCIDRLEQSGWSSSVDGDERQSTSIIRTTRADANLSLWTERTSPDGADLSTFRIHVNPEHTGPVNQTCQTGVRYRVNTELSGGSPPGLLPDAHGYEVLWFENGRRTGCSASVTSPLVSECDYIGEHEPRQWANATVSS